MFRIFQRVSPEPLGYVRSKLLSLFVLFDIDNVTSASILHCLEITELQFDKVRLKDFCQTFCETNTNMLYRLWDRFCKFLEPFKKSNLIDLDFDQSIKQQSTRPTLELITDDAIEKDNEIKQIGRLKKDHQLAEPFEFLFFLLFVFSFEEKNYPLLIYWLWFTIQKRKINIENVLKLLDEFWGKSKEIKSKVHDMKLEIRKTVKSLKIEEITSRRFQILDWRVKGAWSQPFVKLKQEFCSRFLNQHFWTKHSLVFQSIFSGQDGLRSSGFTKLKDQLVKGVPSYRDHGNRQEGRRILRCYMRFVRQYYMMVEADQDEDVSTGDCLQAIGKLITRITGTKDHKTRLQQEKDKEAERLERERNDPLSKYAHLMSPTSTSNLTVHNPPYSLLPSSFSTYFPSIFHNDSHPTTQTRMFLDADDAERFQSQTDSQQDLVPLEYKYRHSLGLTNETLYQNASEAAEQAKDRVFQAERALAGLGGRIPPPIKNDDQIKNKEPSFPELQSQKVGTISHTEEASPPTKTFFSFFSASKTPTTSPTVPNSNNLTAQSQTNNEDGNSSDGDGD